MALLPLSLLAGILTILSPCVFPMLPIIIGGSLSSRNRLRPYIIISALTLSIILFTLILKASTMLLAIPNRFWAVLSGSILILLSLTFIFPKLWTWISVKLKIQSSTSKALQEASEKEGLMGALFIGLALGPVFTSCSPTYAYILATVLPQNFFAGLLNLVFYSVGLTGLMLLIALGGRKVSSKFNWALNEKGKARFIIGIIFFIVGIAVLTGLDKAFESWLLDIGFLDFTGVEAWFLKQSK